MAGERANGSARGGLYFPIKLRCADVSDLFAGPELVKGVACALGRAFSTALSALPVAVAQGDGIRLRPPEFLNGDLGEDQRTALLARIRDAIQQAARAQNLNLILSGDRKSGSRSVPEFSAASPGDSTSGLSEPFDPRRFDPQTAEYELPSYNGGTEKVSSSNKSEPFKNLLRLFDVNIQILDELLTSLQTSTIANARRVEQWRGLRLAWEGLCAERKATFQAAEVLAGRLKADDVQGQERGISDRVVQKYYLPGAPFPVRERVANREVLLQRGAALVNLVWLRVGNLDREAAKRATSGEEFARDAFQDVGSIYLELLTTTSTGSPTFELQSEAFVQLAFLDSYYFDVSVILAFAVIRYVRHQLPILWDNLQFADGAVLRDIRDTNDAPSLKNRWAEHAIARALLLQKMVNDQAGDSLYGDLPKDQSGLRWFPTRELAGLVSAHILQLQVEVPVIRLMDFRQKLAEGLSSETYVGVSLFEFSKKGDNDRQQWSKELGDLRTAFETELGKSKHPGFEKNVAEWESELNKLHGLIQNEIHNLQIRRLIGEQLPFLFLAVGVTAGVGAWVARIANGSRWLVVLAEATTLTLINVAAGVATTGKAPTVTGVATQFGTNLALAGLGQFFQAVGVSLEAAQGLSAARRVLLLTSLKAGAYGATTALQTTIQSIEAIARKEGGETSFTELLTINLIMNGLGLFFGAALRPQSGAGGGKALALSTPSELVTEQASRGISIDEAAAQEYLELRGRFQEFLARNQRLAQAANAGKVTPEEFERFRKEGIDLADELSRKLPRLAKILDPNTTPEQIQAFFKAIRSGFERATFNAPVRLLPEFTPGLVHVGEGPTYTYDPANPPKRLDGLRASFVAGGLSVRGLIGGGYEVADITGKVVFQALPLSADAQAGLPKALEVVAEGPKAELGLERLRSQTAAPELPAQLAQAAQTYPNAANRLLQVLARGSADRHPDVWRGLSAYLKAGNIRTLTRATFHEGDSKGDYAAELFDRMAKWGPAEVQGLEALYEIRPRTTSKEIGHVLFDFEPAAAREVLREINTLAPVSRASGLSRVIGQLTTEFTQPQRFRPDRVEISPAQRGATGTLAAAVELLKVFPGQSITFEVPGLTPLGVVRIEDIVIIDPKTGARILGLEIKEVTSAFLGRRAPKELAADIARDAYARNQVQAFGGKPRGPYATFLWLVRGFEIETQATGQLHKEGLANPTPQQINARMRANVTESLEDTFSQPEVLALPPPTQTEYRNLFDQNLPFLRFF